MKKKNVGLALGGGGVRGFAHIGVLEVLEENGLNASFIVGTSMGAIVGGGYALFKDIKFLKNRALQLAKRKELQDIEKSFDWNTISHKKNFHKPASFFAPPINLSKSVVTFLEASAVLFNSLLNRVIASVPTTDARILYLRSLFSLAILSPRFKYFQGFKLHDLNAIKNIFSFLNFHQSKN